MSLYIDHKTHRVESTHAKAVVKVDTHEPDKWVLVSLALFVTVTFFALWAVKLARYGGVL